MRKLGIFILIYNVAMMLCTSFEWYANNYVIIDLMDIPIYVIGASYFFRSWWFRFKTITIFEQHSFISVFLLLGLKMIYYFLNINYQTYEFYFWLIVISPILLKIERNINYE